MAGLGFVLRKVWVRPRRNRVEDLKVEVWKKFCSRLYGLVGVVV